MQDVDLTETNTNNFAMDFELPYEKTFNENRLQRILNQVSCIKFGLRENSLAT